MKPVALHALIIGTASACGLMLLLWSIHLPLRHASVVDSSWADGLALPGVLSSSFLGGGYVINFVFFLLRVTGMPRGEDYSRYQQSTSAFLPWFPRN